MKKQLNEIKRLQELAGISPVKESSEEPETINVDGMTGILVWQLGQAKLYSAESTDTGSSFDYIFVFDGKTEMISIPTPPEYPVKMSYVESQIGDRDPFLISAIVHDMNDELNNQ